MEKAATNGGSRNWRKTAAQAFCWSVAAASAACVASFSFERTLDEVAGAVEISASRTGSEADERVAAASPSERLLS